MICFGRCGLLWGRDLTGVLRDPDGGCANSGVSARYPGLARDSEQELHKKVVWIGCSLADPNHFFKSNEFILQVLKR